MAEPYDRIGVLDAKVVDRLLMVADGDSSFVEEVFSTYKSEGRRRLMALNRAARTRDVHRIAALIEDREVSARQWDMIQ